MCVRVSVHGYLANICLNQWCLARKFWAAILLQVLVWPAETFQYVLMSQARKTECVSSVN